MATLATMARPADEPAYRNAARDVGANLQTARITAGLSQDEVAEKMGVSQGMVHHWEAGRHVPSWDRIGRLCRILSANPYQVLEPILGPFNSETDLTVEQARRDVDAALRRLDRAMRDRGAPLSD